MSRSLGNDKHFFGPKHNIYAFSWFYLVYLIWYYYLSVKFVIWIVKQKIENKQNLFKKAMGIDDSFLLAMTPWHILPELLTRYLVAHTRLVHVTYI